jgi:urease accessory protein
MNLRLLQLGDSALPIGGYSQSWGLEAAIDRGIAREAMSLESWVRFWLRFAVAPFEGIVVGAVCRMAAEEDWPGIRAANQIVATSIAPPTLRKASQDMGEQLLTLAEAWPWAAGAMTELHRAVGTGAGFGEWHHAPVFGTLCAAANAMPAEAVAVFLHQTALGGISAGVRGIPVGHTHGQIILARLHEEIESLADEYAERPLETAGSYCPAYEVLCHAQSRLYTRLFRS